MNIKYNTQKKAVEIEFKDHEELDNFLNGFKIEATKQKVIQEAKEEPKRTRKTKLGMYLNGKRAEIEKLILNPEITLTEIQRQYAIHPTIFYHYFGKEVNQRYKLFPYLKTKRNRRF